VQRKKRFQIYSPARQRLRKLLGLWALFGFTLAFLVGLLSFGPLPSSVAFKPGQVSPRTMKAERTVEVINLQATEAARKTAADGVPKVFVFDPGASQLSEDKMSNTFRFLSEVAVLRRSAKANPSQVRELLYQLPISLSPRALETLTNSTPEKLRDLETRAHDLLWKALENGVRTDQVSEARRSIQQEAETRFSSMSPNTRQAIVEVAAECIVPNRNFDREATLGAQEAAMAEVKPVTTVVPEGAVVVREGEVISPEHMRVLDALGVNQITFNYRRLLGHTLLVASLMLVTAAYLGQERRDLYLRPRELGLIAVIGMITAFVCRSLSGLSPFLAPVAVASVLATVLVESRLAFLLTAFCALYVGVLTQSLSAACVGLMSGIAGIMALGRADHRSNLIAAMVAVAFTNTVGALTFSLIAAKPWQSAVHDVLFGSLNGVLSVALAVGVLPVLEHVFSVTTHFRLLDISNPGEPLLQRLLREAPGTYQHSIMVANLAEAAAQAIGANALRCKVGAYYHDIGKMKRPRFFVENQMGGENPHEKLTPTLSTMIIHSHVKDGLELARQHRLPDVIVDFIAQHHGTSLVSYFYHQACSRNDGQAVFEDDFRYPGPKPQSRETGIVLICDGIEAAARCLSNPTPEKITELVNKMIRHHLDDGQLDECDLSLKDLRLIRESLIRSLQGIYHNRLEYPEPASLAGRRKVTSLRKKA
jgi:cyclic-di-AMP phosphodiesterase PgpH